MAPERSYSQVASAAQGLLILARRTALFSLLTVLEQLHQPHRELKQQRFPAGEASPNLAEGTVIALKRNRQLSIE